MTVGCAHRATISSSTASLGSPRKVLSLWGVNDSSELLGSEESERSKNAAALLKLSESAGVADLPEIQTEWNRLLIEGYLVREMKANQVPSEIDDARLRALYEESPLVRVRHLVLLASSPGEKAKAREKLIEIEKELKGGAPFPKVVQKFSDDAYARMKGGDLDFRGIHNLPAALYEAARDMKVGEVSRPIDLGESVHLLQIVGRRPFAEAGAPYLELLRGRARAKEIRDFAASLIAKATRASDKDTGPARLRNPRIKSEPADRYAQGEAQ